MHDVMVYPALFRYHEDGISVTFPDFPGCLTCADNTADALYYARDALSLRIWSDECDNIPLPKPTEIPALIKTLENGQIPVPVDVNMSLYRARHNKPANVNKMCTVPEWLCDEAKNEGINFSQALQDALMEKLGIKREIKR